MYLSLVIDQAVLPIPTEDNDTSRVSHPELYMVVKLLRTTDIPTVLIELAKQDISGVVSQLITELDISKTSDNIVDLLLSIAEKLLASPGIFISHYFTHAHRYTSDPYNERYCVIVFS